MKAFKKLDRPKKKKKEARPKTFAKLLKFENGDLCLRIKPIKEEKLPAAKYDNGEDMPATSVIARFELEDDQADDKGRLVIMRCIGRCVSLLAVSIEEEEQEDEAEDAEDEADEAESEQDEEAEEAEEKPAPAPRKKK